MRYTFTVSEIVPNECPFPHFTIKRVDVCIRGERIKLQPCQFVEIEDELDKTASPLIFSKQDDLDEWLHSAACAYQWMGKEDRQTLQDKLSAQKKYDVLEETDDFKVEINIASAGSGGGPGHSGAQGYTLGQLKLEDNNVKTAAAAGKPRVAAIPPIAIMALGAAMQTGADKYGYTNWRETAVTASVFFNAIMRHMWQWYSGEDFASDTKVQHLAHAMAGPAIILDAIMNGVFIDDRPKGLILGDDYEKWFKGEMLTPTELYARKVQSRQQ